LGEQDAFQDQKRYRELSREHSYLSDIKEVWERLRAARLSRKESEEMLEREEDAEFAGFLREDIEMQEALETELQGKLESLLIPPDPKDSRNTILEVRAGTGGAEAALFVADCVRMYKLYADRQGWSVEQLAAAPSDLGGYKEYVMGLSGKNVNRFLKHEGGTHRVQRVPETETQGRVHTSAVTVAVLLEPKEESDVAIDEKDLRVDTYRSSGAGGQHVNTTDSAVRLTHLPTGIVSECQDERSQHKNRAKAMRLLKAKIADAERQKRERELASNRASQVGSGDRSERIRTYNFPQNRVTDHRINLTLYKLDAVMKRELEEFSNALIANLRKESLET